MRNYRMEDGLSHSSVYRIFQDSKGFIWFSTDYSLCSFDGTAFHNYANDSLLNASVMSVAEDAGGRKLISTLGNGVVVMSDSGIHRYRVTNKPPLNILYAVADGARLWIVAIDSGRHIYEVEHGIVRDPNIRDSQGKLVDFHSIVACGDELLFCTNDGIYKAIGGKVQPWLPDIIGGKVTAVKKSIDGSYWVGQENRVVQIKNGQVVYTCKLREGQFANSVLCDKAGNTWIAIYGQGVILINNGQRVDITSRLGLHARVINDMMEDREGNVWIATYGAGVYKVSTLDILNYPLQENQLNIYCTSIAPVDSNRMLIGTIGRVGLWDKGVITPLQFRLLKNDDYVYFVRYVDGMVYVGTPSGLLRMPLNGSENDVFVPGIISGAVSVYEGRQKQLWVGSYRQIYQLHDGMVTELPYPMLKGSRMTVMTEDHKGAIWLGSSHGVIRYSAKGEPELIDFSNDKLLNTVYDIKEDSRNRLWIATEGGLVCRDEAGNIKVFKKSNGLNHNKCNRLAEDHNNTLWVGTLRGLNYIDLETLEVKSYGAGVYPDEVLSLYCDSRGVLFVGTANGLASIKTNHVMADDAPPDTYITTVRTASTTISNPTAISLPFHANRLIIDFIGVSVQYANAIEYRYRLDDIDDNWHITKNTSIELSALPPGSYTFLLCARKNNGPWGDNVSLFITVATPFWRSWWFTCAVVLIAGVFIFLVARYQTRQHEAKKRLRLSLLNKVTYLKQQALGALINPHFIFNCMNSIQHYLNRHDNDKANEYLADFARLIRMTMENAQDAFISLDKEIERILLYLSLEQLRFGDNLSYTLHIAGTIDPAQVSIPNMILQPYIENAIWHGVMPRNGKGLITIRFERANDGALVIQIIDDGVGFDHATSHKGKEGNGHFGMKLTEERLQLLHQLSHLSYKVSVRPNPAGEGTMVEIELPDLPAGTQTPGSTDVLA